MSLRDGIFSKQLINIEIYFDFNSFLRLRKKTFERSDLNQLYYIVEFFCEVR